MSSLELRAANQGTKPELTEPDSVAPAVRQLLVKAREHRQKDRDQSFRWCREARILARQLKDDDGWYEASMLLFELYHSQGQFREALDINEEVATRTEILDPLRTALLNMRSGVAYYRLGLTSEAFDYYQKALPVFQEAGNVKFLRAIYTNLGVLTAGLGEEEKALDYFSQVSQYIDDTVSIDFGRNLNNIGTRHVNLKNFDRALSFYHRALAIHKEVENIHGQITVYLNLSRCYRLTDDFAPAKASVRSAFALLETYPNDNFDYLTWLMLGSVHVDAQEPDSAVFALSQIDQSATVAQSAQRKKELYELFHNAYLQLDSFEQAHRYLQRQKHLEDTLIEQERSQLEQKLTLQKARLEQEQQATLAAKEEERQALVRSIMVGAGVALAIIIGLILYYQRMKARREKELAQAREQLTRSKLETEQETNERLKEDLSAKTRELTSHALLLIERNQLMDNMDQELKDMVAEEDEGTGRTARKISQINRLRKSADHDWENFKLLFNEVHPEFFTGLSKAHPSLTPSELRHCALVKLNLRTTQIAAILQISPDSVKTGRYRIRKKLDLPREVDLSSFIIGNF